MIRSQKEDVQSGGTLGKVFLLTLKAQLESGQNKAAINKWI